MRRLLFLLLVPALVQASPIYKCVDSQGRVNFTDGPCPAETDASVVRPMTFPAVATEDDFGPAIEQRDAGKACESAAKDRAAFPSTVDFSFLWSAGFQAQPDGRATYVSAFTAKNAFGVDLEFEIACYFKGKHLYKVDVSPAR
ncbi:DUF4124 domain-containing protein [Stutzerimonas nitrititolerans]|uniref:DUF4124 domain-containing protein n=1 Tax=Stutzerimonas nitrititolerans TaxID=2482751 RepID=UPI0035E45706